MSDHTTETRGVRNIPTERLSELYEARRERNRLLAAIAEHREDVREYVHRNPDVAKKANAADERLWANLHD